MAAKSKAKRVVLWPERRPDSFTRSELMKAIKEVKAARRRRQKPSVSDGSK